MANQWTKIGVVFDRRHGHVLRGSLATSFSKASEIYIVVGFLTEAGVRLLDRVLIANRKAVRLIAVGHAGRGALEGLVKLRDVCRIPAKDLRIDRGAMARARGNTTIFLPMLHSKIYYAKFPDGTAKVYVGSHNLTEFAISGANCEASISLSGPESKPSIKRIKHHIDEIRRRTDEFDPSLLDVYAWKHRKYLDTLYDQRPYPESYPIVVMAAGPPSGALPKAKEVIYFEIPIGDDSFASFLRVRRDVHIHLITNPASVSTLRALSSALRNVIIGHSTGAQETGEQGTSGTPVSLNPQWIIRDINHPILEQLAGRPIPRVTKALQVNVTVDRTGKFMFDYSPPEGYDYIPELGEKVLNDNEISELDGDNVFGAQFTEMRVLREMREIGSVERRPKRDSFNSKGEWKGTVRLKVTDGEPTVWRAHVAHDPRGQSEEVQGEEE